MPCCIRASVYSPLQEVIRGVIHSYSTLQQGILACAKTKTRLSTMAEHCLENFHLIFLRIQVCFPPLGKFDKYFLKTRNVKNPPLFTSPQKYFFFFFFFPSSAAYLQKEILWKFVFVLNISLSYNYDPFQITFRIAVSRMVSLFLAVVITRLKVLLRLPKLYRSGGNRVK